MTLPQMVLRQLADGDFHSGPSLGQTAGCSRTAVWKTIQSLQNTGLEIYSVRGKGYRLAKPIELLDRKKILAGIDKNAQQAIEQLDVFYEIDSTNAYLLNAAKQTNITGQVCLAECQRAGRGRRGRQWVSPPGGNLYLSLLWRFHAGAASLGGLSLAVAVAVVRALQAEGLASAQLKWPNDILFNGEKLAGILLELSGEAAGPCAVVIGLGLNVRLSEDEMKTVDQPWTDLETALGKTVPRNNLAAQLLSHMVRAVTSFEREGLRPFMAEWAQWDILAGKEVTLDLPTGARQGVARGVDDSGALLLARNGELQRHHSGEVSVLLALTKSFSNSDSA